MSLKEWLEVLKYLAIVWGLIFLASFVLAVIRSI